MADVFFGEDFDPDEEEEDQGVSPLDEEPEEEQAIDPLLFIRSFVDSDDAMKRHRVAQTVSDAVRWLENDAEIEIIFQVVRQLSMDGELRVRVEVIEELPDVIAMCLEEGHDRATVLDSLLPVLAKSLYDPGDMVRKAAHNSLAALLEHSLIDGDDVEKEIVDVLKRMVSSESCVSQLEAAKVVMRTTPRVSQDVIVRSFLPLIQILSGAQFFEVRKMCASDMGSACLAVDRDECEKSFLPIFFVLCKDAVWGVRKGCAEAAYDVSLSSSMDVRTTKLAPVFVSFLNDSSKWVQKSAFQSLGAFISTFHTPPQDITRSTSCSSFNAVENNETDLSATKSSPGNDDADGGGDDDPRSCNGETDSFDTFLYWKVPLPDIEEPKYESEAKQPLESPSNGPPAVFDYSDNNDVVVADGNEPDGSFFSTAKSSSLLDFDSSEEVTSITWNFSQLSSSSEDEAPNPPPQDVVPSKLLDFYISMVDPVRVQTLDLELPMHCAFAFPAVALTLGAPHWGRIRKLYSTLHSSLQWKVRRTLAFSVHELAKIVNSEAILNDLLPAFDSFTKDVDEVRIGALSHLSEFLLMLPESHRKQYLKQVYLFQQIDNKNNWRFRHTLAEQLGNLCSFCGAEDVNRYIAPITLSLAIDRVCDVRIAAMHSVGSVLARLRHSDTDVLIKVFIDRLINQFADSSKWVNRQTFVSLCHHVLTEKLISLERFGWQLLPRFLALAKDKIPNVRLAVSKSTTDLLMAFDRGDQNSENVCATLRRLLKDEDQDVKGFAQTATSVIGYISQENENSEEQEEEEEEEEFVDASSEIEADTPTTIKNVDVDTTSDDKLGLTGTEQASITENSAYRTEEF